MGRYGLGPNFVRQPPGDPPSRMGCGHGEFSIAHSTVDDEEGYGLARQNVQSNAVVRSFRSGDFDGLPRDRINLSLTLMPMGKTVATVAPQSIAQGVSSESTALGVPIFSNQAQE